MRQRPSLPSVKHTLRLVGPDGRGFRLPVEIKANEKTAVRIELDDVWFRYPAPAGIDGQEEHTAATLEVLETLWRQGHRQIGTVIQSYLKRSEADIRRLNALGSSDSGTAAVPPPAEHLVRCFRTR